ncbi:MAG TPA: fumarylacetoacetate hydrolase family protein [Usitatibacter sp.]|jgi:2-keto-4-pentenoate hydratase/2-oxohepta-3-ene-1,7-dioic acid hydratase in catechol pathway|nr:fumarylacetoacetate hydrolase family protein [Usitatibacter sp.]
MKLATFSPLPSGEPRPGLVIDDKRIVDIPAALGADADTASMLGIIRAGAPMLARLRTLAGKPPASTLALADVKLHAPIPRPAKNVFCVGWNYLEHFEEGAKKLQDNRELPKWPVFFSKATTAVTGPFDTVPFDAKISTSLDWEVELGMIIGTGGKDIAEGDAMRHVFGYTVINDVSWRDLQRRHGGQWHKGKSLDGTCPMGPWIVTADSIEPNNLRVTCRVNGVTKQDSNTKFLYFKLPRLIVDLSMGQTLEAGDVISTGTPEGVGFARTPPEFMKPGDLLETEIEGIGTLRNPIGK